MRRWGALLLMLAMVLSLTGCGEADPEKEAAKVVAEVGDSVITKGEALLVYDFLYKQLVAYQAYYYGAVAEEKELVATAKATTLNLMAERKALELKLDEFGLTLTDEDLDEIENNAINLWNETLTSYSAAYGMTEEEVAAMLEEEGYSLDALRFSSRSEKVDALLRAVAVEGVAATEEEIKAKYDELVSQARTTYETTPGQYGTDVTNGSVTYVRPEGYRNIKNLVIVLPEDISDQISQRQSEMISILNAQYSIQMQLYGGAELDDATKANYTQMLSSYEADYTKKQEEVDALAADGLEQVRSHAEEVLALCVAEGADFDALMEEYNGDGTTNEAFLKVGYPVSSDSTTYVTSFTEGAMALEKVGDISGLVESNYGFHILMYASDIEPGDVPLDEVRGTIAEEVLSAKQDEAFELKQVEWIDGTKIKTYVNRL